MSQAPLEHLTKGHCVPCEGGTAPMTREEYSVYLPQIPEWKVSEDSKSISRELTFKDFVSVLAFVNKIGAIAESEGHHPDLNIHDWKYLTVTLMTHAIGGLSINDFVLASKIDEALNS